MKTLSGNTPLHIACLNGQGNIITELRKHDVQINALNHKNQVSNLNIEIFIFVYTKLY